MFQTLLKSPLLFLMAQVFTIAHGVKHAAPQKDWERKLVRFNLMSPNKSTLLTSDNLLFQTCDICVGVPLFPSICGQDHTWTKGTNQWTCGKYLQSFFESQCFKTFPSVPQSRSPLLTFYGLDRITQHWRGTDLKKSYLPKWNPVAVSFEYNAAPGIKYWIRFKLFPDQ